MGSTRVFIDTNFLLIPGRLKVDIFSEIERGVPTDVEFVVLEGTVKELQGIADDEGAKAADRNAARLAILLLKQKSLKTVTGSGNVDEILLKAAEPGEYVATQDKVLKALLRENGVHVIALRGKQKIIIEN